MELQIQTEREKRGDLIQDSQLAIRTVVDIMSMNRPYLTKKNDGDLPF